MFCVACRCHTVFYVSLEMSYSVLCSLQMSVFCVAWRCHTVFCVAWRCHTMFCIAWKCHTVPCVAWRCHTVFCVAWRCHTVFCVAWRFTDSPTQTVRLRQTQCEMPAQTNTIQATVKSIINLQIECCGWKANKHTWKYGKQNYTDTVYPPR